MRTWVCARALKFFQNHRQAQKIIVYNKYTIRNNNFIIYILYIGARETACAHADRCANCAQCAQIGKRRRGAGFRVRFYVRARCGGVRHYVRALFPVRAPRIGPIALKGCSPFLNLSLMTRSEGARSPNSAFDIAMICLTVKPSYDRAS